NQSINQSININTLYIANAQINGLNKCCLSTVLACVLQPSLYAVMVFFWPSIALGLWFFV
ncbi:hypothetical protein, partial [Shewanella sp. SG41-4]|uniref:hypothetical protein n=1 Tax=Shewanella sp. SG41-4 TaxID=2760976 RepID=UPI001C722F44